MKKMTKTLLVGYFCAAMVLMGLWAMLDQVVSHQAINHPSPFGPHQVYAEQDVKWTCGMHPLVIRDEEGLCPICEMDLTPLRPATTGIAVADDSERKIKYWVAPMDPSFIRDEPGLSPMGMDLVPVYEDQAATGAVIVIDPVTVQNMGIRSEAVVRRDLGRQVRTVGQVEYAETAQYSVNSKVAGWIEKLYINATGLPVTKGAPLLEIYSPELVAAQQEFLLALQHQQAVGQSPFAEIAAGANRLLEASRQRLQLWDISAEQIQELERSGTVKKTLTLYAPYAGVVTVKSVNEGMAIKVGAELMQISDLSQVWVQAQLYESDLPWARVGQSATVSLPYDFDQTFTGELDYIYPYADGKTRTIQARIVLNNDDGRLKPQMFVNVTLQADAMKDVLTIPADAVVNSGEIQTVFVALGEGRFEPRRVKLGPADAQGQVVVLQGLLDGERVVTSAQFMLDSESQLREAIRKMLEPDVEASAPETEMATEEDLDELF